MVMVKDMVLEEPGDGEQEGVAVENLLLPGLVDRSREVL